MPPNFNFFSKSRVLIGDRGDRLRWFAVCVSSDGYVTLLMVMAFIVDQLG